MSAVGEEPRHRLIGSRVVELGAGAGFLGIFLAKLGAQVCFCPTDLGHGSCREAKGAGERSGRSV